jgi:hypothetical protein
MAPTATWRTRGRGRGRHREVQPVTPGGRPLARRRRAGRARKHGRAAAPATRPPLHAPAPARPGARACSGVCPRTSLSFTSLTGWPSSSSSITWLSTSACLPAGRGRGKGAARRGRERCAVGGTPRQAAEARECRRAAGEPGSAAPRGWRRALARDHGITATRARPPAPLFAPPPPPRPRPAARLTRVPPHAGGVVHDDGAERHRQRKRRAAKARLVGDGRGDALRGRGRAAGGRGACGARRCGGGAAGRPAGAASGRQARPWVGRRSRGSPHTAQSAKTACRRSPRSPAGPRRPFSTAC